MSEEAVHRSELGKLSVFSAVFVALGLLTYVVPGAEAARPWLPGEPLPLVGLLQRAQHVEENAQGEVVIKQDLAEGGGRGGRCPWGDGRGGGRWRR